MKMKILIVLLSYVLYAILKSNKLYKSKSNLD